MVELPFRDFFKKVLRFNWVDGTHLIESFCRIKFPSKHPSEVFDRKKTLLAFIKYLVHVYVRKMLQNLHFCSFFYLQCTTFELAGRVSDAYGVVIWLFLFAVITKVHQRAFLANYRLLEECVFIGYPSFGGREKELLVLKVKQCSVCRRSSILSSHLLCSLQTS